MFKSHEIHSMFHVFKYTCTKDCPGKSILHTPYLVSYLDSTKAPEGKLLEEERHVSSLL